MRGSRGFRGVVVEPAANLAELACRCRVAAQNVEQPRRRLHRLADGSLGQELAGFLQVFVSGEISDVERVGADHPLARLGVVAGNVLLDVFHVGHRAFPGFFRNREVLLLCPGKRVRDMNSQIRPGPLAARPEPEATVAVLKLLQPLEIAIHRGVQSRRVGHVLGLERRENIFQRGGRENPRADLLGAAIGVLQQVDVGVGQLLKRGRAGRDFEPAKARLDVARSLDGLRGGPVVEDAVSRERFRRRGRPHGKRDLGGVRVTASD